MEKMHDALKGIQDESKLDSILKFAKLKTNAESKEAIMNLCVDIYKKPYKGSKNQVFENASKICLDNVA